MTYIIIQARTGSTRFPNKIFEKIKNYTLLQLVYDRCNYDKNNRIIVCTTNLQEDDKLVEYCIENNYDFYRGDCNDLINRFYYLCKLLKINENEPIVRITSDCPFIDPQMLKDMLVYFNNNSYDYIYNTGIYEPNVFIPEGSDIEIFNMYALQTIFKYEKTFREHATGCIFLNKSFYDNHLKIHKYQSKLNFDEKLLNLKLSIDTKKDLDVTLFIYNNFQDTNFSYQDVLTFLSTNYDQFIQLKNNNYNPNTGQKFYEFAKTIIPGGTQLLSKRPEMFLPNIWPAYYSSVNGYTVVDLDGNKYTDMGINAIGSCILGCNDRDINSEVIQCINKGNMCTLNHVNEIKLTQKMLELHPWANMARYTRTSGEACCVAIRIARSFTNKVKIAFCGYHGWHDWYLATNINSNGLDKHLLTGLSTQGVPLNLENTIYPFTYNKIEELDKILQDNEIGIIIMEPYRNIEPLNNFLNKVRERANKHNIILIFDEVTSAFRTTLGGIHLKYNVEPDIAVFGKAISNGYPLGVIIGKKNIMIKAEETFISSTYWTEGIGFTAGLATINKFEKLKVYDHILEIGSYYIKNIKTILENYNIDCKVTENPAIVSLIFSYSNSLEIKTLFNQFMLENGFLTTTSFYVTYMHDKYIVDKYLEKIKEFFNAYGQYIKSQNIKQFLKGPVAHGGFQRLT